MVSVRFTIHIMGFNWDVRITMMIFVGLCERNVQESDHVRMVQNL